MYLIKEAQIEYDSQANLYRCRVLPELNSTSIPTANLPSYLFLNRVFSLYNMQKVIVMVEDSSNFQQGYILDVMEPKAITSTDIEDDQQNSLFEQPQLPNGVTPDASISISGGDSDTQLSFLLKQGSPPYIFKSEDYTIFALTNTMMMISAKDGKSYIKMNDSIVLASEGNNDRFFIGKGNDPTSVILDLNGGSGSYQLGTSDNAKPYIDTAVLQKILDKIANDITTLFNSSIGTVVGAGATGLPTIATNPVFGMQTDYPMLKQQLSRSDVQE